MTYLDSKFNAMLENDFFDYRALMIFIRMLGQGLNANSNAGIRGLKGVLQRNCPILLGVMR